MNCEFSLPDKIVVSPEVVDVVEIFSQTIYYFDKVIQKLMNQMTEITKQHRAKVKVQASKNAPKNSFSPNRKSKVQVSSRVNRNDLKDYVLNCLRDYCDGFGLGFNYLPQDASLDDYLLPDEDALMSDWVAIGEDMQNAVLKMVKENLKGS